MQWKKRGKRGKIKTDSNVNRVRVHRIEEFLKNLLNQLGKDVHSYKPILEDAIKSARDHFSLREEVTIVEIGLIAFWLTLQRKNIQEFTIRELILVAKEDLERNISAGRVLKFISKVKAQQGTFDSLEKLKEILRTLFLRLLRGDLKKKVAEKVEDPYRYTCLMDQKIQKAIEVLGENKIAIMGNSRKVTGAIIFYILDKIVSNKLGINSIFSAKEIGEFLGVSQYTILRKYKNFQDLLEEKL